MPISSPHAEALPLRVAKPNDTPALAALINTAYIVEAFFKKADRTSPREILTLFRRGWFLVLESNRDLIGSVYVEVNGKRGYFGMLSIAPSRQKQGLGARLVAGAEDFCRDAGCTEMELHVVNLRTELPAYYGKLGYTQTGTREFPEPDAATQPCHLIVMSKRL